MRRTREFFVCQQGFPVPNANPHLYSALMVQPRIVAGVVVAGTIFQRPEVFLVLAAVMAWAALVPSQNLFDAIYNYTVAYPRGLPALRVAPAPRRFSQAFAAAMSLAMGLALLTAPRPLVWLLEGLALVSVASVVVRRFCMPAHLYHMLRGRLASTFHLPVASESTRC
jgi:hypothetical protein